MKCTLASAFNFLPCVLSGLVLVSRLAQAQIVNMQSALSGDISDGPGVIAEARQEKKSGNTNTERLAGQANFTYKRPEDLWLLTLRREYSSDSGQSSADSRFYHLRYRYAFNENWGWEVYAQEDADRFRRSARRTVFGTGPRYQISPLPSLDLALSSAYMHEREEFSGRTAELLEPDRITRRISNVFYLSYKLQDWGTIANVTYYQPEIGVARNHRTLNEASLALKINAFLSYRLTHSYAYHHRPPAGVQRTDKAFMQSLSLKI
jgi:putative salt-induced outer membrane protein YdiY